MMVLATVVICSSAADAHHSFQATFKSNETIQVEGVITDYRFYNPHILVYLDVTNSDGTTTNWMSEGAAATLMRRSGWDKDTLSKGDLVRVHGNSTYDGSPMVSIDTIDLLDPDDHRVVRVLRRERERGEAPGQVDTLPLKLADGRPNLSGAWIQNFAARRGPPGSEDSRVPFNVAGTAAQAAYNQADDPQIFCDPPGLVRQAAFTPHPVRITQNDDHVILEYEEYAGKRIVYLSDEAPATVTKTHLGNSVARYEGDALVITTTSLLGNPTSPQGNQLSDQTTVVEAYTRADHPQYGPTLSIETTITDPGYLNDTWTVRRTKVYSAGYEFIDNDCRPPLRERTSR
jgi:hypothetical protein